MIRIKIILILFLISLPLKAEIVIETGKHKHLGKNYTKSESCKIAEQKAKNNAIIKSLGLTVSSESISNCSEVDGEYNCERNKFSLFQLNGDLTDSKIIKENYDKEIGTEILFCEITIEANVEPIKKNNDPNFQFEANLNQKIFRSGEILEIKISTSKEMYMAIFQWLPYGGNKYNVVTKIFPNKDYNKNTNDLIKDNLELKYETYFPDEISENESVLEEEQQVEEVVEPIAVERSLKILPKRRIWAGYINIATNQKYQKVFKKEFALNTDTDWLLLFGKGTAYLEVNGEVEKFSSTQNMRFKYVNGKFEKITVTEFKILNKGRKW